MKQEGQIMATLGVIGYKSASFTSLNLNNGYFTASYGAVEEPTRHVEVDKMKAAFAATPLCQRSWAEKGCSATTPTKLCAISALVSFAGVQPNLIAKMVNRLGGEGSIPFFDPILEAEYGLSSSQRNAVIAIFDRSENEYTGIVEVLALCETWNRQYDYTSALREDAARFPQLGPEQRMESEVYLVDLSPALGACTCIECRHKRKLAKKKKMTVMEAESVLNELSWTPMIASLTK